MRSKTRQLATIHLVKTPMVTVTFVADPQVANLAPDVSSFLVHSAESALWLILH
jgi:hypothetical protein